jgi:hypothetical protein
VTSPPWSPSPSIQERGKFIFNITSHLFMEYAMENKKSGNRMLNRILERGMSKWGKIMMKLNNLNSHFIFTLTNTSLGKWLYSKN